MISLQFHGVLNVTSKKAADMPEAPTIYTVETLTGTQEIVFFPARDVVKVQPKKGKK